MFVSFCQIVPPYSMQKNISQTVEQVTGNDRYKSFFFYSKNSEETGPSTYFQTGFRATVLIWEWK